MKPIKNFDELKNLAKELPSRCVSVVRADEVETLQAVRDAVSADMVDAVLVGPETEVRRCAEEVDFDLNGIRVIDAPDDISAARAGVELVRSGEAQILLKGFVVSSTYLKAILDRDHGIRGDGLLSHVTVFDIPGYDKLLTITDAAINIAPDFDQKVEILKNAIIVAKAMGIKHPKTTYVCAKEVPYERMPRTMEALRLQELADEGEFGDILFDAPLAMDLAISPEACRIKKIESPVAGDADLLLLPDIESGNILYKTLIFLAGAELAAVVMGATNPVILTSRADSAESKLCSLVLSGVVANYIGNG
jgi:phosphate butyryltransferase